MTETSTSVGPPQLPTADFYLGAWLIQPTLGIVARDSAPVHLEPKAMLVLVCLAQQAGEVVSKEDLLRAVWPETFVTEHVLTHAVWQLRHAFHDRDIIQTVPRQGYRLNLPARPESGTTSEILMLPAVGVARSELSRRRRKARTLIAAIQTAYAALAAILIVSFGGTASVALREPAFFARHSRLVLLGVGWLTAIYSVAAITAVAMWVGRRRVFAAFERWFCAFCPVNILCGLMLLGVAADRLYFRSSSGAAVMTLLLLPFVVYAPYLQRRMIRRYHLDRPVG